VSKVRSILILGDIHFNHEHKRSIALAKKIVKRLHPSLLIQAGDLCDGYALNSYGINPRRRGELLIDEVVAAKSFLDSLRPYCDELHVLEGNHEERLKRSLEQAPQFASTHPGMRELLGLEKREWTPYGSLYKVGDFHFAHDVGKAGVNAAKDSLAAVGSNIVFGHTHRAGLFYGGNIQGERHVSLNVGWLGDAKGAEYANDAQKAGWTRGIAHVDMLEDGRGWANFVPFLSRGGKMTAVIHGKAISL
jgi:predicted phosphodiesterase